MMLLATMMRTLCIVILDRTRALAMRRSVPATVHATMGVVVNAVGGLWETIA
jgi:hypothetical protein